MDERIGAFMRDVASDGGLDLFVVGENARRRLAELVKTVRTQAEPGTADESELDFRKAVEEEVAAELARYRDTNNEQHLSRVLTTIRVERERIEAIRRPT